jgi:predicted HTH domain antitoxin
MSQLVLEIPHEVVDVLKVPQREALDRVRQELAVRLYAKDLLSFGKARELTNLSYGEFSDLLAREEVARHYDLEDLAQDLQTLEHLP